jgi:deazaflavin-dependent oxidoreductase (nitroreductase family)
MSEKEEFEKLPKAMPNWIKDHVELYLSDPDKARMSDSTIGGGPGPLPTLLLIARGAKSGKLRPLRLLYQEMDGKCVVIGSKGGAPTHSGWYVNLSANPSARSESARSVCVPEHERRAAMNERAAGRRWRRCIHPTTTTRSESVRGRFRWWFSSRSARYERFFLHPPETMLTNFYFGT